MQVGLTMPMKSPRKKPTLELMPSQATRAYWIYATRRIGNYPESTERSGKWLIFVPMQRIDDVWRRIKRATEQGLLGDSAKAVWRS